MLCSLRTHKLTVDSVLQKERLLLLTIELPIITMHYYLHKLQIHHRQ